MIKKDLQKMRTLKATQNMMRMALEDTPRKVTSYYTSVAYQYGMYLRCCVQNNILKVAVFLTEYLRIGAERPAFEIFIDRPNEKFITYDRLDNKWLTAKVDLLPWPGYVFHSPSRWISKQGHKAIREYLGGERGGYDGVFEYQLKVRANELTRRHKRITDAWDMDLSQVPALPKDWERWSDKVGIQENYIFYEYSRKGADTGYCSYCEKWVPIKKPRHNKEGRCPCCRKKVTFKAIGRVGHLLTSQYWMYLIQRCETGFVIREFQGYRVYPKGECLKPKCFVSEVYRTICDKVGGSPRVYEWGRYRQREMRWVRGGVYHSPYTWIGPSAGMVYGKTLPSLGRSELKCTGLVEAVRLLTRIDPSKYLSALSEVPQLEQFAKAGLGRVVWECMQNTYSFRQYLDDHKTGSLTQMLGINTQELKRLRVNNGGARFLEWLRYERVTGKNISDHAIHWFCSEKIEPSDFDFIADRMSIVQIYNYIRRQMADWEMGSDEVLNTWADYLSMAKRLGMDTGDAIVYRVRKLRQRHDELVERFHGDMHLALRAGEILGKYPHVEEIYASIKEKFEFANKNYTIVVPSRIEEILKEGENLHHCAATSNRYWERIERREAYVMFLRRSSAPDESYYTLEVEPSGAVRQKRTMFDRQEADIEDATKFLKKWQKEVSKRLTAEDREQAEKSKEMRIIGFEQLRKDQVIINTAQLGERLLVDVLMADLMEAA